MSPDAGGDRCWAAAFALAEGPAGAWPIDEAAASASAAWGWVVALMVCRVNAWSANAPIPAPAAMAVSPNTRVPLMRTSLREGDGSLPEFAAAMPDARPHAGAEFTTPPTRHSPDPPGSGCLGLRLRARVDTSSVHSDRCVHAITIRQITSR